MDWVIWNISYVTSTSACMTASAGYSLGIFVNYGKSYIVLENISDSVLGV